MLYTTIIRLSVIPFAVLVAGCDPFSMFDCGYETVKRVPNPEIETLSAVLVEINCGATTSYVYKLALVDSRHEPINWEAPQDYIYTSSYESDFNWVDKNTLRISVNKYNEDFWLQVVRIRGIRVEYINAETGLPWEASSPQQGK